MKAREFKEFVKYSKAKMKIQLNDLDEEIAGQFGSFGFNGCYFPVGGGCQLTEEELERFWDKEVVNFTIGQEECNIVYATCPPTYPAPTYILRLSISNLTEEERVARAHEKEVQKAKEALEKLVGTTVTFETKN